MTIVKKELTAQELDKFIRAAQSAYNALATLSVVWEQYDGWDETLCDGYPFGTDLENQVCEVGEWIERLEKNHAVMLTKSGEKA